MKPRLIVHNLNFIFHHSIIFENKYYTGLNSKHEFVYCIHITTVNTKNCIQNSLY